MENVNFQMNAFSKLFLHCLKYLSSDCYGVLIGNIKNNIYNIVDVIPLSHERLFAPQLEISFKLIELSNTNKDNIIIGFYENLTISYLNDQKFSSTCNMISEMIHNKSCKFPLLITVNNKEGTIDHQDESSVYRTKEEPEIKIFKCGEKSFDCLGEYKITNEQKENMRKLLAEKRQVEIVDFDEHFMDCNLDWRNDFLNK